MSRRSMCMVLVVLLALWGVGLPRFVHVMTAHVPPSEMGNRSLIGTLFAMQTTSAQERSSCSRCCSSCSLSRAIVSDVEGEAEEDAESDCGEHGHNCAICDLLATLLTNVPAMPAAPMSWEPVVERLADAPASVVLGAKFDSHSPRGPPMHV